FVFYFGILADLTPPVALACFAAAPIARASGLSISIQAIKVAAAGFVIPFMAVYTPSLMLQPGGDLAASWGMPAAVGYIVFKCLLAIGLWGAAVIGFGRTALRPYERLLAAVASVTLIAALPATDEIGFALSALVIGWHLKRHRNAHSARTA
ncbi:MAG: TRAP transporter permease, partial [Hydrogenophaga sp.]|nr:TRAP transporter permease [Hydrogenophaga sp.]